MIVPTVKVLRDGGKGVRIINASDYDPSRHTLADQDQPAPQSQAPSFPSADAVPAEPRKRGRPRKAGA